MIRAVADPDMANDSRPLRLSTTAGTPLGSPASTTADDRLRCLNCGLPDDLPRYESPSPAENATYARFGYRMHRCTRCGTVQNRARLP